MALGKLFRRFSFNGLGRRWMKRFGRSLRNRFLRQDVHRKQMRMERLEDRSLLTTLYWLATNSSNWNDNNWSAANNGSVDSGLGLATTTR